MENGSENGEEGRSALGPWNCPPRRGVPRSEAPRCNAPAPQDVLVGQDRVGPSSKILAIGKQALLKISD